MDQPPTVVFTAFADAWLRATEMEIGTALCTIGAGWTGVASDMFNPR